MANMRWKKVSYIVSSLLLATVIAMPVQAQSWNPKDKKQMRQLALESCLKTRDEKVCNCFADNLVSNLNEKEWRIFIAEQSKSSAPPSGITESDLDNYGRKLATAGNACGM